MPQRIQWNRFKGKLPPAAKSVMRPGPLGNPFPVCVHRSREQAVDQFTRMLNGEFNEAWLCDCGRDRQRQAVERYPDRETIRREYGGFNLACACNHNGPCHGDPLLAVANPVPAGGTR